LNRISGITSQSISDNSWTLNTSGNHYREKVTDDANGNILTYKRNDNNAVEMDDLTYNDDRTKRNRLMSVVDASASTAFSEDVKGTERFEDDAIGNLISQAEWQSIVVVECV
jgi:hypothetical protein